MKKALLVIDVQEGMYTAGGPVFKGQELLETLQELIQKCRLHEIPVIYVQHNGPQGHPLAKGKPEWNIHSAIAPKDGDIMIEKETPDSFYKTNLHKILQDNEIEHVIMSGMQTEYCVDTTTRSAFSEGYKVTLVRDAHSTFDSEQLSAEEIVKHHNAVLGAFADVVDFKNIKIEA
ncbi:cysteine hydrolase [Bacillus sp. Xin]|uniref:cysteine hydrolase family protein n=1 Tax=unclassified Bacillus (in: firmicutes) TaxID=185979 RepID=UPI0015748766|nr:MULTISPECIES: cysteine hydrolase family protein [unclassified Bacillus (in: firmicutes)]MBC6973144.1 cysteine hydrolase [Bacillus sp. Xin]NSW36335.1 cysteine hydrolase [Bacillus sp. Xin1]